MDRDELFAAVPYQQVARGQAKPRPVRTESVGCLTKIATTATFRLLDAVFATDTEMVGRKIVGFTVAKRAK